MAEVKISALSSLTAANSTSADLIPVVSSYSGSAVTYKMTLAELKTQLLEGGITIASGGAAITGNSSVTGALTVSSSLSVGNGITVTAGGATITGGLTVATSGLVVSTGGITVTLGGLTVAAGATAVQALTATTGTFSSGIAVNAATAAITLNATSGVPTIALGFSGVTASYVKSGGANRVTLSNAADVTIADFNDGALAITADFTATGSINSTAGNIRVGNNIAYQARNAADTAYLNLLSADGNNNVRLGDNGASVVLVATSVSTGASQGDVVLANTKAVRAVNAAGTNTLPLVTLDAGNLVQLGSESAGAFPAVPMRAAGSLPAASALMNGVLAIDTTNNRLCYWSGGVRYYINGTSF